MQLLIQKEQLDAQTIETALKLIDKLSDQPKYFTLVNKSIYTLDYAVIKEFLQVTLQALEAEAFVGLSPDDLRADIFQLAALDSPIVKPTVVVDPTVITGQDWPVEDILPGLSTVVGNRSAGKTFFVRKILDVDIVVRYAEPVEDVDLAETTLQVSNLTEALSASILISLVGGRVAIDSFKSLVYGLDGAALAGGLSSGVFDFLTTLNNLFASFNVHVVTTLNPILPTREATVNVYNMIAASTTGAYLLVSRVVEQSTFRTTKGRVDSADNGANLDDDGMMPSGRLLPSLDLEPKVVGRSEVDLTRDNSSRTDKDEGEPRKSASFDL